MNLLLLLSALLSALTGVGARAIGPEPVQAVAQENARIVVGATVAKQLSVRPVAVLPHVAAIASAPRIVSFAVAVIPVWTSRRRE